MAALRPEVPAAVPTVAKLPHPKRCVATTPMPRHGSRQCLIYADATLNGRPLCRQHLDLALLPADVRQVSDRREEVGPAAERLAADYAGRSELLEQVLGFLRLGVPDPTTGGRLVLAVIPAVLAERIEKSLQDGR